jgi:hypothetical protein
LVDEFDIQLFGGGAIWRNVTLTPSLRLRPVE